MESRIVQLGRHRELIAEFDREFFFPAASEFATSIFTAWEAATVSPCPANASRYGCLLQEFVTSVALAPHVAGKRAELKAMETAMLDAIHNTAGREKIDLGNLLMVMRGESGVQPNRVLGDETRHRLFSNGRLDGLAKN